MLSGALIAATDGIFLAGETHPKTPADYGPGTMQRLRRSNPHYVRILLVEHLREGLKVLGTDSDPKVELRFGSDLLFSITRPTQAAYSDAQIGEVLAAVDQRADRLAEIILQQTDLFSFLAATSRLHDVSHRWMLEVLRSVQDVATIVHAQVKHRLNTRRPVEIFAAASPIIQTPQHSSLPSGHSVEAMAVAYVMSRLMGASEADTLSPGNLIMRMAERIAVNRHVAGVHFPFESLAGSVLGLQIGRICLARLTGQAAQDLQSCELTADAMASETFTLTGLVDAMDPAQSPGWLTKCDLSVDAPQTDELREMYEQLQAELA